jgi:hypothetical protein
METIIKESLNVKEHKPIDLGNINTYPLQSRGSKVNLDRVSKVYEEGSSFNTFLDSLPDILAGTAFRDVITGMARAHNRGRGIILAMGAHMVKCGLSPLINDLIHRKLVTGLAMNGAGVIHDVEFAVAGKTSEDVAEQLRDGSFGMARETAEIINEAVVRGYREGSGFGNSVGKTLSDMQPDHGDKSILVSAYTNGIPLTVHVAIGTDIVHMHAGADGASIGGASHLDFRIFCSMVKELDDGGVFINAGSAVILPEVFMKAVSVVRNLGNPLRNFTTVNLDFIRHYRPMENVVRRPVQDGGKGYHITGHHELLFPLLVAGYKEFLRRQ